MRPEDADLRAILESGRHPVTLTRASVQIWGLAPETLPRRAGGFIEAMGRHRVTHAVAGYTLKLEKYEALCRSAEGIRGKWEAGLAVERVYSVLDLAQQPEKVPDTVIELTSGFETHIPVTGRTVVGVDVERAADGDFRYRLRFYLDYESEDEQPDIREQRPSETAEGQSLLPYLRELEDEALDGKGPRDWVPWAEGLAMEAHLLLWGDGRDLIDYDYEE